MYESEMHYKLQGKTVGKSSVRECFRVLSASLTDCHHSVKLHVGKRSEGETEALWFLYL